MAIIYRLVKGSNLTATEFDGNFHDVDDRIVILEALPSAAAGIDEFQITGDQLTVVMTDATTRGPYTLPVTSQQFEGAWAPATSYTAGDIITANGSTYIVTLAHTSEAVFDPGETTTDGDYYGLLLTSPEGVLPTGGAAGQALVKSTGVDYAVTWADFGSALETLTDVAIAGVSEGDILWYSESASAWINIELNAAAIPYTPDEAELFSTDVQDAIQDLCDIKLNWDQIGVTVQAYDAQLSSVIRQNSQSAAYTTVVADGGKHILHPSADTTARIFTIQSNGFAPYPLGTAITFVNQNAAGVVTIAINAPDTMRLAGAGTAGSRTLAANGVATALKIATTEWIISGTGLT